MFRPLPHLFAELYRECRVCGEQCAVCAGDPHENICFTQRHFTHGSLGGCRLAIHQLEHTPLLALSHPQLKGVAALETIKVINNVWNMSPESPGH